MKIFVLLCFSVCVQSQYPKEDKPKQKHALEPYFQYLLDNPKATIHYRAPLYPGYFLTNTQKRYGFPPVSKRVTRQIKPLTPLPPRGVKTKKKPNEKPQLPPVFPLPAPPTVAQNPFLLPSQDVRILPRFPPRQLPITNGNDQFPPPADFPLSGFPPLNGTGGAFPIPLFPNNNIQFPTFPNQFQNGQNQFASQPQQSIQTVPQGNQFQNLPNRFQTPNGFQRNQFQIAPSLQQNRFQIPTNLRRNQFQTPQANQFQIPSNFQGNRFQIPGNLQTNRFQVPPNSGGNRFQNSKPLQVPRNFQFQPVANLPQRRQFNQNFPAQNQNLPLPANGLQTRFRPITNPNNLPFHPSFGHPLFADNTGFYFRVPANKLKQFGVVDSAINFGNK